MLGCHSVVTAFALTGSGGAEMSCRGRARQTLGRVGRDELPHGLGEAGYRKGQATCPEPVSPAPLGPSRAFSGLPAVLGDQFLAAPIRTTVMCTS